MKHRVIVLAAALTLALAAAPAALASPAAPAAAFTCSGSYGWSTSTGVSPSFGYTVWVDNDSHCQQRSSGLCTANPGSTEHNYARGGWIYAEGLRSGFRCPSNTPFLRHLWLDVRPNPRTNYAAISLCPTQRPC
jgi:hypothetical protein